MISGERSTVAVTGAGGFIGTAVVSALRSAGVRVRALDGPSDSRASARQGVRRWRGDVNDIGLLRDVFDGAECVVHLAGPPSVSESFGMAREYANTHVLGTVQVLRACAERRIERLVYLSSADVYGQQVGEGDVSEDAALAARSPYAACKIACEQFIHVAVGTQALRPIILRPFSIYGPGMSRDSLIGTLVGQIARGRGIRVHDVRPVRDYCYIDDLVRAVVRVCTTELGGPLTLNIGSGSGTSVQALIDTLCSMLPCRPSVEEDITRRRPGAADIVRLVADIRRARDVLGWSPAVTLREGLRRVLGTSLVLDGEAAPQ